MAADIIIHKATKVPVGKDQEQHLEMARNFANRFNHLYERDVFPEPYAYNFGGQLVKVPGLDGSGKMGKSEGEGNAIFLADSPEIIRKKVMRAVTDGGPTEPNQAKPESISNLFQLMQLVSNNDTLAFFEERWNACDIRYGDMKKQLAEDMIAFTNPLRERIAHIQKDEDLLQRVIRRGAEKNKYSSHI
jgi:tryptophanyl-tRNA synthetase